MRRYGLRFNDRRARQRAVGHDRGHLQADDKRSADHRGNDLRQEPRAFRSDQAKQRHRQSDRKRGRRRAHRDDQSVSAQPAPAAARDQHVDERRRERQRHQRHRQRDGRDAHREEFRCGRGRRQNEIEVGVGVERARRRFHGLRHHQQPRQQDACGDCDQCRLVRHRIGIAADHPEGDEMHEDNERRDGDQRARQTLAPAGRHHRKPVAPGQARTRARANQRAVPGCAITPLALARRPKRETCLRGSRRRWPRHCCCRLAGATLRVCLRR